MAPAITFRQVEAALKDVPLHLLPEVYEYLLSLRDTEPHVPNEVTRQVLEDADAGRDLTVFKDAEDMFRFLGLPH